MEDGTEIIGRLFDRMDSWRHLPSYQLERRADLFFSLYLPEVLEAKLGYPIMPQLIPEFPVRIGTIYPHIPIDKSYKIDYVALSQSRQDAVFVELKTESLSRRPEQDAYLLAAQEVGMNGLLEGLLSICKATNSKRKYCCLLDLLADMDLLSTPESLREILCSRSLQGINAALEEVSVTSTVKRCHTVYVQPRGEGPGVIPFGDLVSLVQRKHDPVSQRFAQSLKEWASVPAGQKR